LGHDRLHQWPATRNWRKVVGTLRTTDNLAVIADRTAQAADRGINLAKKDQGVAAVIFRLMNVIWSSREENFKERLRGFGVSLPKSPALLDLVGAFDDALDRSLRQAGHRSDFAEMARYSAVEALTDVCRAETGSLFGVDIKDTQKALKKYATPKRFGTVGQNFFGKFLYRFLDYHLSRELPNHIGPGMQFASVSACEDFKSALALHCHQTAGIVKEFSGCWPSATEFKEGISVENVRTKFVPVALKKIRSELKQRSGMNA